MGVWQGGLARSLFARALGDCGRWTQWLEVMWARSFWTARQLAASHGRWRLQYARATGWGELPRCARAISTHPVGDCWCHEDDCPAQQKAHAAPRPGAFTQCMWLQVLDCPPRPLRTRKLCAFDRQGKRTQRFAPRGTSHKATPAAADSVVPVACSRRHAHKLCVAGAALSTEAKGRTGRWRLRYAPAMAMWTQKFCLSPRIIAGSARSALLRWPSRDAHGCKYSVEPHADDTRVSILRSAHWEGGSRDARGRRFCGARPMRVAGSKDVELRELCAGDSAQGLGDVARKMGSSTMNKGPKSKLSLLTLDAPGTVETSILLVIAVTHERAIFRPVELRVGQTENPGESPRFWKEDGRYLRRFGVNWGVYEPRMSSLDPSQ
ncbi:hypothetical protein K438DRAFT_1947464 [Mycena galopus ATCC 62051]|nr:hypothetical protein K438DRAFT_1947464 [Mycena galopus ATCC 62051]